MGVFEMIGCISLFCLGLREITDQDRIGFTIRQWFIDHYTFLSKPIMLCCACMSSFWGSIIFWAIHVFILGMDIHHWDFDRALLFGMKWFYCCIGAAFVNGLFWQLRQLISKNIPK